MKKLLVAAATAAALSAFLPATAGAYERQVTFLSTSRVVHADTSPSMFLFQPHDRYVVRTGTIWTTRRPVMIERTVIVHESIPSRSVTYATPRFPAQKVYLSCFEGKKQVRFDDCQQGN